MVLERRAGNTPEIVNRPPKIQPYRDAISLLQAPMRHSTSDVGLIGTEGIFRNSLQTTRELLKFLPDYQDFQVLEKKTRDQRGLIDKVDNRLATLKDKHREVFGEVIRKVRGRQATISLLAESTYFYIKEDDAREDIRLKDSNPLIGDVGAHFAIGQPEISTMQMGSIAEAALEERGDGRRVSIRVAIPFVSFPNEFVYLRKRLSGIASALDPKLKIKSGAIISTPRGAITAGETAESADFLIINTDVLTQITLGMSRADTDDGDDDIVPAYLRMGVLENNPFTNLDKGVGAFVAQATRGARKVKPHMEISVLGPHYRQPALDFYQALGINKVIVRQ